MPYIPKGGIGLVTMKVVISTTIPKELKDHTITSNTIGIKLLYLIILFLTE